MPLGVVHQQPNDVRKSMLPFSYLVYLLSIEYARDVPSVQNHKYLNSQG